MALPLDFNAGWMFGQDLRDWKIAHSVNILLGETRRFCGFLKSLQLLDSPLPSHFFNIKQMAGWDSPGKSGSKQYATIPKALQRADQVHLGKMQYLKPKEAQNPSYLILHFFIWSYLCDFPLSSRFFWFIFFGKTQESTIILVPYRQEQNLLPNPNNHIRVNMVSPVSKKGEQRYIFEDRSKDWRQKKNFFFLCLVPPFATSSPAWRHVCYSQFTKHQVKRLQRSSNRCRRIRHLPIFTLSKPHLSASFC